jgi:tryptophan 2,3-dioxygenase
MADETTYAGYLALDRVLGAQHPLSDAHDELLFIIQHQTSELWMKLAIHEIETARRLIVKGDAELAFKMMARVARIFEQLNSAWDVLRTMTPAEYTRFRGKLGPSSGFQSWQYRAIEFLAGNRSEEALKRHAEEPEAHRRLAAIMEEPSLYDAAIGLLDRSGFAIADEVLRRDLRQAYRANASVRAAWAEVYRDPVRNWTLYQLAEKLVDFEDYFRRWRFNHVTTVERVIGHKRGTGGTAGVLYLKRMLEVVLFPELWEVRTEL